MSTQSKLALLQSLINAKRAELKSLDLRVANKAKGSLIGLYAAKRHLQDQLTLEAQQANIFQRVG